MGNKKITDLSLSDKVWIITQPSPNKFKIKELIVETIGFKTIGFDDKSEFKISFDWLQKFLKKTERDSKFNLHVISGYISFNGKIYRNIYLNLSDAISELKKEKEQLKKRLTRQLSEIKKINPSVVTSERIRFGDLRLCDFVYYFPFDKPDLQTKDTFVKLEVLELKLLFNRRDIRVVLAKKGGILGDKGNVQKTEILNINDSISFLNDGIIFTGSCINSRMFDVVIKSLSKSINRLK